MRCFCYCLMTSAVCLAQVPTSRGGRQSFVFENRVVVREAGHHAFRLLEELPPIKTTTQLHGAVPAIWDGFNAYRMGWTAPFDFEKMQMPDGNQMALEVGEVIRTKDKEACWFWHAPTFTPLPFEVLGAWNHQVLVELESSPKDKPDTRTITLALMDPSTGLTRELLEISGSMKLEWTSAVVEGEGFVFLSSGEAFRVDFTEQRATRITESFWNDLDLNLCKDTNAQSNPDVFGPAFLDSDGSILIAAQPLLVLEREDVEHAWERLSKERKAEMTRLGYYPFDPEKGIGWKDMALFIRFRPDTRKFDLVEESRYKHLVEDKDVNFIIRSFLDSGYHTLYFTDGEKIQPFNETLIEKPEPAAAKVKQRKPDMPSGGPQKVDSMKP